MNAAVSPAYDPNALLNLARNLVINSASAEEHLERLLTNIEGPRLAQDGNSSSPRPSGLQADLIEALETVRRVQNLLHRLDDVVGRDPDLQAAVQTSNARR